MAKGLIQGHRVAQAHLGIRFATGVGVTKNTVTAVKWWRQSAEQGYMLAQYNLGVMYAKGHGVQKNVDEALKWYRRASAQGHQGARQALQRLNF